MLGGRCNAEAKCRAQSQTILRRLAYLSGLKMIRSKAYFVRLLLSRKDAKEDIEG